ncbi:hypothetical protein Cni_G04722 [Canna indica]|uniref:Uncharacterized protein n=1 Tax=Canna indica TaxID=4628 RepID=A0AAQ3Q2H3_9LILI|nr:hypothetical protein Cni_G04722 [Canna indica]
MSLVDYASSDDEEIDLPKTGEEKGNQPKESASPSLPPPLLPQAPPPVPPKNRQNQNSIAPDKPSNVNPPLPSPSLEGLPDVSVLFAASSYQSNQKAGNDHSSRVAAAIAESASRKRESNRSTFPQPSSKHPRGQLAHLRNVPNTMDGLLVPPQLTGRSNVVTEDIGKLFVKKNAESSH